MLKVILSNCSLFCVIKAGAKDLWITVDQLLDMSRNLMTLHDVLDIC